jgi:hypothetical protein
MSHSGADIIDPPSNSPAIVNITERTAYMFGIVGLVYVAVFSVASESVAPVRRVAQPNQTVGGVVEGM